jgi:LPS sulfotransferase NodH
LHAGVQPVTRFLLLGAARTGSTLVGNALVDHPEILFYGEIFHHRLHRRVAEAARETMGHGVLRRLPLGLPVCRDEDDARAYLAGLFSRGSAFAATGFKLFYDQARRGRVSTAWDYVADDPAMKVVHLLRANWLESLISQERAIRTGVWHSADPPTAGSFCLSPEQCLEFFEHLDQSRARAQSVLDSHPVLELEYSQLAADFHRSVVRVCSFLGVSADRAFVPRLAKLSRQEPRDELANYEELRDFFRPTPYARFFA